MKYLVHMSAHCSHQHSFSHQMPTEIQFTKQSVNITFHAYITFDSNRIKFTYQLFVGTRLKLANR